VANENTLHIAPPSTLVLHNSLKQANMEAIAAVAGIVQLIDFSGKILVYGYGFLAQVSAAPSEIRILLTEVANVNMVLDRVRELANDSNAGHLQITTDKLIQLGALDNCRVLLERSQECLEKCKQVDRQGLANVGRKLKWAFIEKDVKAMIDQLRSLLAQIDQAINLDSALVSSPFLGHRHHAHCD
jgi:hypothetical protein